MLVKPLKLNRLNVTFQAMSIKNAVRQAKTSGIEESNRIFLESVVIDNKGENGLNFDEWTAQERLMVIAHYLMSVSMEDGESPDFEIGGGTLSDYIDYESEFKNKEKSFEFNGETWTVVPLTGRFIESVERIEGTINNVSGRLHYEAGYLASQLRNENDDSIKLETSLDDWLHKRMSLLLDYTEADYNALLIQAELQRDDNIHHYLTINNDDSGLVVLPKEGGEGLVPVRFSSLSAISERIKTVY